jgi:hypothetical protein
MGGESGSGRQQRPGRGGDGERVLWPTTSGRAGAHPQAVAEAIPRRWQCSIAGRLQRGAWGRDLVRRRSTVDDRFLYTLL